MEYNSKEINIIEGNLETLRETHKEFNLVFNYDKNTLSVTKKDNSLPGYMHDYKEKINGAKVVEDIEVAVHNLKNQK